MITEHLKSDGVVKEEDEKFLIKYGNNINTAIYSHEIQAAKLSESTETKQYEGLTPTVSSYTISINEAEIASFRGFETVH